MIYLNVFMYMLCVAIFVFIIYQTLKNIEYIISVHHHNIPFVASPRHLRRAVVREIKTHYPNAKTLCDIGSGYGGLMRYITRRCPVYATGLENMPMSVFWARVLTGITKSRRACTIWCDAFEYLDACDGFDIAVAYLGPGVNDTLARYIKKFRVLIVLDVPISNIKPTRVIDVGHGHTRYGRKKFPHKLFIYER